VRPLVGGDELAYYLEKQISGRMAGDRRYAEEGEKHIADVRTPDGRVIEF